MNSAKGMLDWNMNLSEVTLSVLPMISEKVLRPSELKSVKLDPEPEAEFIALLVVPPDDRMHY